MKYVIAGLILMVFLVFYNQSLKEILNTIKIGKIKKTINSQYIINLLSIILAVLSLALTLDDSLKTKITEASSDYIIIIIVGFLIILIMLLNHLNGKNDRIFALKEDLKSDTKELWKRYSDLDKFYKEQNSQKFMESFVKNNSNLISIQRYVYSTYILTVMELLLIFRVKIALYEKVQI